MGLIPAGIRSSMKRVLFFVIDSMVWVDKAVYPIARAIVVAGNYVKDRPLWCDLVGHRWNIEPPWSVKEYQHRPYCERCGDDPHQIRIVGGTDHEGEDRVPFEDQ